MRSVLRAGMIPAAATLPKKKGSSDMIFDPLRAEHTLKRLQGEREEYKVDYTKVELEKQRRCFGKYRCCI